MSRILPGRTHPLGALMFGSLMFGVLLTGCGGGPKFAESFDSVPERPSASNLLTRTDIERYPMAHSLEQLLMQAFPQMRSGISIRGMGPPLFLIDGVPTQNAMAALALSTRDIQRVELVRDGGSTALYGFRGSNGAILVTLRR